MNPRKSHDYQVGANGKIEETKPSSEKKGRVVGESSDAEVINRLMSEVQRLRHLVHDLRNPVGSVSVAVELLLGPFRRALDNLESGLSKRVETTLLALSESARQLRHLVTVGTEAANFVGPTQADTMDKLSDLPRENTSTADIASESPMSRSCTPVLLDDLLRRLEILTVTRSALPALLAVDTEANLQLMVSGPELLRGLSNLVENAIEASAISYPGPGPWTIEIIAYQIEETVFIDIRNRGLSLPKVIQDWLSNPVDSDKQLPSTKTDGGMHGLGLSGTRRVIEHFGGALSAEHDAETTTMRIALPSANATKMAS